MKLSHVLDTSQINQIIINELSEIDTYMLMLILFIIFAN